MRVKFTVKRPLSSVVATRLKSGISPHVVVTVTPGIGRRSESTTLPISLPCLAEASPGAVNATARSMAILRCSLVIVVTFLVLAQYIPHALEGGRRSRLTLANPAA